MESARILFILFLDDGLVGSGAGEFELVGPLFGDIHGGVGARAAATTAPADVNPMLRGRAADNEPQEFRFCRDGECGCAGRFGEGVAVDAGTVFLRRQESVTPAG